MEIITKKTPHVVILENEISVKKTFTEKYIIMIRWDVSGNFQIVPHTQEDDWDSLVMREDGKF